MIMFNMAPTEVYGCWCFHVVSYKVHAVAVVHGATETATQKEQHDPMGVTPLHGQRGHSSLSSPQGLRYLLGFRHSLDMFLGFTGRGSESFYSIFSWKVW